MIFVSVHNKNLDQAWKWLQRKIQREGIYREMKFRMSYEKPSEKKVRKAIELKKRLRKLARKNRRSYR